jgi:hypothetical protein
MVSHSAMSQLPELLGNKNMELDMYSLRGNPLARSPGQVKLDSDKQDSKLTDAKTLNASVFFILRLKIVTGTTKNVCAYFSKCSTKIVHFYLCPVPKCVFSVFNFRINLKT